MSVRLNLTNLLGAPVPWPAGIVISLLPPSNTTVLATYDTSSSSWILVGAFSGALAGGDSLVFYTAGTGAANGLLGLKVVAIGQEGFAGSVASNAFP
jgi:hypothetical protein